MTYRTGRKLGRTLYRDDQLIGIMDRPEDADMVVSALNGPDWEKLEGPDRIPDEELDYIITWIDKDPRRKTGTGKTVYKLATELKELRMLLKERG